MFLISPIKNYPVKNIDHLLEDIKTYCDYIEAEYKNALTKIAEYNQAEEIAKKDEEIAHIKTHSIEILAPTELDAAKNFWHRHYESCQCNTQQWELHGTGIGTIVKVRCNICGEIEDITDITTW